MRSNLFLAALAAGAAHAYEKRVYVTDWTTVTITKTVTASAVTETVTPAQQVQIANTIFTTSTEAPAVAETKLTSDLAKKSTEAVPVNEPAPTEAAQVQQEPTSWFSTAWTSTFEAASSTEQAPAPASTSSTTQAAASTSTASLSNLPGNLTPEYKADVLHNHNVHRSNHSAGALDWHDNLYIAAWNLADRCVYEHNTKLNETTAGKYGQNIGYGVASTVVGEMISNLMYNDEIGYYPGYGEADPSMDLFDKWGHFSQIVWKGTTHVACATKVCENLANAGGTNVPFTVCNYGPPGNYENEYGANVLAPSGEATYTA
ncbi:hypothetical protein N7481_009643 [Penicillium waksmanii]|uniref:uncharacterized protein n=1 Tax=Penicillium waksmanii TaxID=69791 RepID=UPI002547A28E|nr:uncharacterized protein N7481_009643 [Penicillium waksmanii]KAJ5975936.1 hypothetical protein N7481_009643 [Penicillium waksmanii]